MISEIVKLTFLGNAILDYIIAGLIIFAGIIGIKIFKFIVLKRLKKWAEKTRTTFDDFVIDVVSRIVVPLSYFGVLYFSINTLTIDPFLKKFIVIIGTAVLTIFVARLVVEFTHYGVTAYWVKAGKDLALERSLKGILSIIKIIVWGLAIAFFLDNLGFKISTVIAGLGIGGVAVALAAQAILKDLFSYFSIIFDRPFEIGDFIIIGDYLGTVEYVGIKTTRIRSLGGEQVVFSNTDLTDSRVRNYKRMEKRRVLFRLGVTYQTSLEHLKEMPKIIEQVIKKVKDTTFDRAHFLSYADFSLVFEVVYYVLGSDYNKYMDTQQQINFAIKEEFQKRKIEFAYPTQTIYLNKEHT
ncbi:MAG: mechanosensitive ion channel family protein [Candidatus Omnitrophota bacterium]|nr:MAG: mechanosensitive ion channel family protein [Candidatus Omnitrophota bacterium]